MKDLATYVNDSINESLLGMIIKLFTNKLKALQKKFSLSENSINELSEKLAEPQDKLKRKFIRFKTECTRWNIRWLNRNSLQSDHKYKWWKQPSKK